MKKNKVIRFLIIILSFVIIYLSIYIKYKFYDVSFEQLLFTISTSTGTSFSAIREGILVVLAGVTISLVIIKVIKKILIKYAKKYSSKIIITIGNKKFEVQLLPPTAFQKIIYSILFLILSILFGCYYLGVFAYLQSQRELSTIFEDYYVDGHSVEISFPDNKRNLIYIYVESLESTNFSKENGGIMDKSYIPNLEKIATENINFSNNSTIGGAYATFGTTWTTAAMIAQTAGVPLKLNVNYNINDYSGYGESLPGIYNLGDVLNDNGYKNYLMLGSGADFGGRKDYFTYHGNYEIYDYNWAKDIGLIDKDYHVWWGFEDRKLYSYAKDKITEIASNDEPFNFTLLTVDTHFIDGWLDEGCPQEFSTQYANVFYCADYMLNDFIQWIEKQDFYNDTTIIISGDHLTMQDGFYNVGNDYQRYVYNAIINSSITTDNSKNRIFTTMDLYPTTLASLGVNIEGDKLGLGTNLFSDKKTLAEELGINELDSELSKRSNYYNHYLLGNSYFEIEKKISADEH